MRRTVRLAGMFIVGISWLAGIYGCAKHPPAADPAVSQPLRVLTAEDKELFVAKVNGAEITRFSLYDMMNRLYLVDVKMSVSEPEEKLRKRALDQVILQELALQQAARKGLQVHDMAVDRAMEQVITSVGHAEGYQRFLESRHSTAEEFRAEVERRLIIQQLLTEEVAQKAVVPEERVRSEFEQNRGKYLSEEQIRALDVRIPQMDDKGAEMKRAEAAHSRMLSDPNTDPRELAKDGSVAVQMLDGRTTKDPELLAIARSLKPGQLSDLIRSANGLHFVKLVEYEPPRQLTYEEARPAIEQSLSREAQHVRRQAWERELKEGATIDVYTTPEKRVRQAP